MTLAAWAVHAYTASGAVMAFLALAAGTAGHFRTAYAWLALQLFVDATDGYLARLARVDQRVPEILGAHLDDLVDYLTYVFVPAWLVYRGGLLPEAQAVFVVAAMLVSSGLGFSRTDAKTADHYFTGFPSYWNILSLYLFLFRLPPSANAVILLACAALVFVPIRYVYPSRTTTLRGTTVVLGAIWGALMLGLLWQFDTPPRWMLAASCVFPIYYVALSLWLHWQRSQRV
jgi:phosphatidylcholine synthase